MHGQSQRCKVMFHDSSSYLLGSEVAGQSFIPDEFLEEYPHNFGVLIAQGMAEEHGSDG